MYPYSQNKEKQESQRRELEKEEAKYRDKYKDKGLMVTPPDVCKNFREEILRQIWEELNNEPIEKRLTKNMLTKLIDGLNTVLTPEEFINQLKPKISIKREELESSEFWKLVNERATAAENQATQNSENLTEPVVEKSEVPVD